METDEQQQQQVPKPGPMNITVAPGKTFTV